VLCAFGEACQEGTGTAEIRNVICGVRRSGGDAILTLTKPVNSSNGESTSKEKRHKMDIKRIGSQASVKGPSEWFTGTVRIDPLFQAPDPARVQGASVTFEPGARTAWHTHPLGQMLIVTAGCGLAQRWGGTIEQIRPGDVVWFPPGEKHWHGATATTAMTHIAIQEQHDGKTVDWMEKVSEEQYRA
jgi:quercetin dioxygenase-like cupin family protein